MRDRGQRRDQAAAVEHALDDRQHRRVHRDRLAERPVGEQVVDAQGLRCPRSRWSTARSAPSASTRARSSTRARHLVGPQHPPDHAEAPFLDLLDVCVHPGPSLPSGAPARPQTTEGSAAAGTLSVHSTNLSVDMTTTFDTLGVADDVCHALRERGIDLRIRHPGDDHPRHPCRSGRLRKGQDRVRQDPGLRPARSCRSSPQAEARPAHRPSPWCPPGSSPPRSATSCVPARPRPWRAHRGRSTAVTPSRSRSRRSRRGVDLVVCTPGRAIDLIERRRPVGGRRRATSSSTRPTAWPTWGSCPRSSGSSATSRARTRRCCSRPRSTVSSTAWCGATRPTRPATRSRPRASPSSR